MKWISPLYKMAKYHRDVYEKSFARLLNKALRKGLNDPEMALKWLDKPYRLLITLLFSSYRVENTDALMDVREHLKNRAKLKR